MTTIGIPLAGCRGNGRASWILWSDKSCKQLFALTFYFVACTRELENNEWHKKSLWKLFPLLVALTLLQVITSGTFSEHAHLE